jgi:hypothetical protein
VDASGTLLGSQACHIIADTLVMLLDPLEAGDWVSRELARPRLTHVQKLKSDMFKLLFDARVRTGRLTDARRLAQDQPDGHAGWHR